MYETELSHLPNGSFFPEPLTLWYKRTVLLEYTLLEVVVSNELLPLPVSYFPLAV